MNYKLTEEFGIKRVDPNNWGIYQVVTRKRKETEEVYQDEKILGYAGDLESAYRMSLKYIPNYVESKTGLAKTIKELKMLSESVPDVLKSK